MKKSAFTLAELGLIFFIMAIIAILFYRTLKPEKIVYNHLYYSAYSQLSDVFRETLIDEDMYDGDGNFDISQFSTVFAKLVNNLGASFNTTDHNGNAINYDNSNLYQFNLNNFSPLSNGMRIQFDKFNIGNLENQPEILVATVDVNGIGEPNLINQDIIQFEINKDGVFPIGDVETNSDYLKFNIISRDSGTFEGAKRVMGEAHSILQNVSYDEAACRAGLKRHTFFENQTDLIKCGNYNIENACEEIRCEIEAVKP